MNHVITVHLTGWEIFWFALSYFTGTYLYRVVKGLRERL